MGLLPNLKMVSRILKIEMYVIKWIAYSTANLILICEPAHATPTIRPVRQAKTLTRLSVQSDQGLR